MSPNNTAIQPQLQQQDLPHHKCADKDQKTENDNGTRTDVTDNGDGVLDMKVEANRLKTFERWPIQFINASVLAKAGFYYMNVDDRVKCEFCKVEIGRWEQGDDPNIDHQRWAPNCPFLRNYPVGNIPIDPQTSSPRPGPSYNVCDPMTVRPNAVSENQSSLGIPLNKRPVHPQYTTEPARLRSYSQWPSSLKQRPSELSEAGFFYTGHGDTTRCFCCGGGLNNWEPEDVPWKEHARCFPNCGYVQLMKGKEFISKITSTMTAVHKEAQALESTSTINVNIQITETKINLPRRELILEKPVNIVSTPAVSEDNLCIICHSNEKNAAFMPCGHVVACLKCAVSAEECPVCKKTYMGVMRVFLS